MHNGAVYGVSTELTSHDKGPVFFTIVAGSGVLGVQYKLLDKLLEQNNGRALLLLVFAAVVWRLLVYAFFVGTIVASKKTDAGERTQWHLAAKNTGRLHPVIGLGGSPAVDPNGPVAKMRDPNCIDRFAGS